MGKELLYTVIDSKKKLDIREFLRKEININPELMGKNVFYDSLLKKYPEGLDDKAVFELGGMAGDYGHSFYHLEGYDFEKKPIYVVNEKEVLK